MNSQTLLVRSLAACAFAAALSAHAEVLTVEAGQSIQAAVNQAKAGDTIRVMPGTYRETVFIDKENITLQGVVVDGKWPVMDGGGKLNDGILASGHGVVIQRFWVKGYKGNGIMTQGANNYKIIDNYVDGGFYGIFPQFGKNGLVARNRITRVEDAGIYVGMSDNVDIIANEAWANVIGIDPTPPLRQQAGDRIDLEIAKKLRELTRDQRAAVLNIVKLLARGTTEYRRAAE